MWFLLQCLLEVEEYNSVFQGTKMLSSLVGLRSRICSGHSNCTKNTLTFCISLGSNSG